MALAAPDPMMKLTVQWLDDHQTLIAGALGFVGVIITLLVNASLERRQRGREREARSDALRRALAEELRLFEEVLKERLDMIAEAERDASGGLLIPLTHTTDIFENSIDSLGLLRSDQVAAVLRASLYVRQMPEKLSLLGRIQDPRGDRSFVHVGSEHYRAIKAIHQHIRKEVSAARRALTTPGRRRFW